MGVILEPWPHWNQRTDWTADHLPDENAANNCGPEAVAECVRYSTGIELPADFIHDRMYAEGYQGYTDFTHLAAWLVSQEIPAGVFMTRDADAALAHTRAYLDRGHPAVALFYETTDWGGAVAGVGGHFCPVIGYSDTTIIRSNPWIGRPEIMSIAQWRAWYSTRDGGVMEVHRRRFTA